MKALIRWLNPVDSEIRDVIHKCSLGYRCSSASVFHKDLKAQTDQIHLISALANIKSKYKVQNISSSLTHKYIWILQVPEYLNSSSEEEEEKARSYAY